MKVYKPTDSELEILEIIWKEGPSSVRVINDILNKKREVGYTTTLKILQIMFEKKLVDRDTSQRSHIYNSLIPESDTKKNMIQDFVKSAFSGSSTKLVMQILGSQKTSKKDLQEIKDLISKLEKEK